MAESIHQAVAAGDYASTSEVIRDAIRVWPGHRDFSPRDLEVVRRQWDQGKASGVAGPLDIPGLIAAENPPSRVAKIVRTHLVDQQLAGIWRDIAAENEPAADRLLLRIDQRLRHLSQFPLMGPLRKDIRAQARMLIEPPFLVLNDYYADVEVVEVVAVVDGRRDLRDLF